MHEMQDIFKRTEAMTEEAKKILADMRKYPA